MIRIVTIVLISLCSITATSMAQEDSSAQNLYFVKKNRGLTFDKNDYQPGRSAFYIYRNCVYLIILKDKRIVSMRIVDIRNDSIYYTPYLNARKTAANNDRIDTLALHPGQFKKIRMIGDRMFGLYSNYSLTRCSYVFVKGDTLKRFPVEITVSYTKDSSRSTTYELVPYLSAQGVGRLYDQRGQTFYYEGVSPQIDEDTNKKRKPFIAKKWVWFTPTNASKISGLNLGLQTMTLAENDTLIIRGMNVSVDLLSVFASMYAAFHILQTPHPINYPDSVDKSDMTSEVTGLSLSGGGLVGDLRIRGVSINGGICAGIEMTGLHITGISTTCKEFKGVIISGLANRTIRGRGLQIALLNHCKNLKGVQLGLWNVNSKRSLPFINWDF